jgi:perosamine synthetase
MTIEPAIEQLLVDSRQPLLGCLQTINDNGQGICFAVDEDRRLVGAVTDGDIRRALLSGLSLNAPVTQVMQTDLVSLPATTPIEDIQQALSRRIRLIPLLDDAGRPVDYASYHRFHRIPILEPTLSGNELQYVTECIRTNWISSQGAYVRRFEDMFREVVQQPYALAVSNGTCALHLALDSLGVGPGDEVIVPNLTFAASINAVLYTGATPVLVDIDPQTWTLDIERTRSAIGPSTRAIMPVHLYGHPCRMTDLRALAEAHGLYIVEDCAEALGSLYEGQPVGSFGDAAAYSFFGNKIITTGEGGMIVFRDEASYQRARILRDHGMSRDKRYWHDVVGYNYRLTNLQAAVGVAQMERLDQLVDRRQQIAARYRELLEPMPVLTLQDTAPWAVSSHWLTTVIIAPDSGVDRDELMDRLLLNGIETRPAFYPLHEMPPYRQFGAPDAFPVSTRVAYNGLSLPSSTSLSDDDIVDVCKRLSAALGML